MSEVSPYSTNNLSVRALKAINKLDIKPLDTVDMRDLRTLHNCGEGTTMEVMNWLDGNRAHAAESQVQSDKIFPPPPKDWAAQRTLRDWFAGMALNGCFCDKNLSTLHDSELAGMCYAMADAMMEARNADQ